MSEQKDRPNREKIIYYHELYERKCALLNDYGRDCSGWQEFQINKALQKYYNQILALLEEAKREERERIKKAYEGEWYGVTDTYCPQGLVEIRQALKGD